LGPGDDCPTAPISVAVAMADKLDTLAGFWSIDEKPTGSKDPYALRRAALGVIRLILENKLRIPLSEAFKAALNGYAKKENSSRDDYLARAQREAGTNTVPQSAYGMPDLLDFFADRLKVHLKEQGVRHDLITAVFALGGEDDLVRLLARVEALGAFLDTEDGANLLAASKRAGNILRIEEKKDKTSYDGAVDAALLAQDEEKALAERLNDVIGKTGESVGNEDFAAAMGHMAALREPVDAFFEKVTVNADEADIRANRLRMLSSIRSALGEVADFSKIEG